MPLFLFRYIAGMSSGNKFCKTCNTETPRYVSGRCIPCTKAKNARWAAANSDAVNKKSRKWNAANAESKRATNAAYRAKNRDQINARRKIRRDENLAAARAQYADKNALRRHAAGKLSKGIVFKLLIAQRWKCACCGTPFGRQYHVDHIIPLSRGGRNIDSNVQLLLPRCNQQKYTLTHEEFMRSRRANYLQNTGIGGTNTEPG